MEGRRENWNEEKSHYPALHMETRCSFFLNSRCWVKIYELFMFWGRIKIPVWPRLTTQSTSQYCTHTNTINTLDWGRGTRRYTGTTFTHNSVSYCVFEYGWCEITWMKKNTVCTCRFCWCLCVCSVCVFYWVCSQSQCAYVTHATVMSCFHHSDWDLSLISITLLLREPVMFTLTSFTLHGAFEIKMLR